MPTSKGKMHWSNENKLKTGDKRANNQFGLSAEIKRMGQG
jgi:hypothetical protein